jgi:PAS domain S-box-containing protein
VSGTAILGVVSYQNNKTSLEMAHHLQRTHQVLDQADEISSLYKDIQLESNTFFIKRDSAVILPYLKARMDVLLRVKELRSSFGANKKQVARVDSLNALLESIIEFSDEALNSQKQHSTVELDRRITTNFQIREQVRKVIGAIKREENRLMAQRQLDYDLSIEAFNQTYFLMLSGIGLLLAATFFLVRNNFNKRIKAQDEQKKAKELFAKIFYESPMGIVISRLDSGEIIDCNGSYLELVKYDKSEILGKSAQQLGIVGADERIQMIEGIRANGIIRDIEIQLTPKDSEPIWVSKSIHTIVIDDELCLLSAILDMTVHKEAELKIKQTLESEIELNKLKSDFVTLASHEFRTPLTAISSSAALAEKYATGENVTKISRHLSRIKASVNLIISMLDEFLSLTKIEDKTVETKVEKINLRETIQTQCANQMIFTKPGQEIIYNHSGEEEIYTDPVLLKNIFNNLVSNAIKYSGENSKVLVSSIVNSEIRISVKDFGIGISPEDQTHLFERFFRASNTGAIQGTGLGLHIMKHYIDILHGSISVTSELGKGSQFEVTFQHNKPDEVSQPAGILDYNC